jgi:hypothetical protein
MGSCPERNIRLPVLIPWEYGPIAFGALSVFKIVFMVNSPSINFFSCDKNILSLLLARVKQYPIYLTKIFLYVDFFIEFRKITCNNRSN